MSPFPPVLEEWEVRTNGKLVILGALSLARFGSLYDLVCLISKHVTAVFEALTAEINGRV